MQRKPSFPPIFQADARLLILGSLPGDASLDAAQYYAHPRNQFWRLLGDLLQQPLVELSYPQRLDLLIKHRIALWDVIADAHRDGSLDSQIRAERHNDLTSLIRQLPALRLIAFNGKTAAKQAQAIATLGIDMLTLPSSSPAFRLPYEQKRTHWLGMLRALA
ncbi:hypoxanthine-DNA glycosylase [Chitinivorax tropicus]|uniref:Hypoxanthine-DNA glycosylase n=1 Tax=Chitinivorax tropicus TaxID=714531 RepID=A0A840MNK3_9PROT|nr:DNA-deoxyinosine glycosylase [Chitinivorax tropicus]MBB5020010.1 hypoxanthine-DNA glycosylase [Chitinivorax tropicus]